MVIRELLELGVEKIKDKEFVNPNLEAIMILSKLLDMDKSYIYAHLDDIVSENIKDSFMELINKRTLGYPVQYILKEKEFMGLNFYIEDGVLIPRPDTEILVEYIVDYIKMHYKRRSINVLDIGIGSGAISLSIAKYCPNAFVYGVDIDETPIKVANINKNRLNLSNVSFYQGDLFEALTGLNMEGKFQIIVSNPPYIPRSIIDTLQPEVKYYEPRLALDGGVDGLDFYRRISYDAKRYLIEGGLLAYEIGYDQGQDVRNILVENGFDKIEVLKDLQGLDRIVLGQNINRGE